MFDCSLEPLVLGFERADALIALSDRFGDVLGEKHLRDVLRAVHIPRLDGKDDGSFTACSIGARKELGDELGQVLTGIIRNFNGGPVGLETIAASLSEESDTIMDVYEPYLLQLAFLERTPRGRVATRRGAV